MYKYQIQDKIKALNLGADAYMVAPFEPEELEAQVKALLRPIYRSAPSSETSFEQANREEQSLKETSERSRKRLLLVENDPTLLLLIEYCLELQGIEVITAKNGREALKFLKPNRRLPDLVVSDTMMPKMDGYAFVDKIRQNERTSWIPVLFLSTQGESQDIINGLNSGADIYMTKPFEPKLLIAQVEALLRQIYRRTPSSINGFAEVV
jgi:DNA-binding response OmpR family regulator